MSPFPAMELQAYVLFATALVISNVLLCYSVENTKIDSSKFEINTNSFTEKGKCVRKITIKGNGVADSLQAECIDHAATILREDGAIVYGRPHEDTFFLYSDTPSSMMVVDNGKCIKKIYSPIKKRRTLSDAECLEVQNKIEDLYSRPDSETSSLTFLSSGNSNGVAENTQVVRPEEPTLHQDSEIHESIVRPQSYPPSGTTKFDPSYFDINTKTGVMSNKCVRTITIKGNNVDDTFKVGCTDQGVNIVRQDGAMAYGKPPKDSFYMFSDTLSTLVVIENVKCTKKTYNSDKKVTNTVLSNTDCSKVQKKIEDLASGKSHESYSLFGDIWELIKNIFTSIFNFPKL